YAAIILGTAAGGILMEFWRTTPTRIGVAIVAIACAGFLSSILIAPQAFRSASRPWPGHPWAAVAQGWQRICQPGSLSAAVASLTVFDAIATLVLLDVLLIAKIELGMGDASAGTIAAFAAVGAGTGALLCGYLSGARVELGIAPLGGLGIAASLLM